MTQILQIFTVIFALTYTICAATLPDQLEQRPTNFGTEIFDENSFSNPNGSLSSPEAIRPFKWNSPKQPVDLESFLGSCRYKHPFSTSLNLSRSFSQEPKSKKSTTGVEAFVEIHFKKPIAQGTSVQSRINVGNTVKATASAQNNKRPLNQPSIAKFFKKTKIEDSDGEVLTDRDSLTGHDSLTGSSSALSTSSSVDDDSHSDSSF